MRQRINSGEIFPKGSAERKQYPITTGVLDYFPDALAAVAHVSYMGNEKHNPGEPLHWSREKSKDHADCVGRHLAQRGEIDPETGISHTASMVWRAMALLQLEEEERKAKRLAEDQQSQWEKRVPKV